MLVAQHSRRSTSRPFHNLLMNPLLQPKNSTLKNSARKQKREKIQYRKWNMEAAKMRLSIFCVRDDFSIFYIGFFLFSSVLNNLFSGRRPCRQIVKERIEVGSNEKTVLRFSLPSFRLDQFWFFLVEQFASVLHLSMGFQSLLFCL